MRVSFKKVQTLAGYLGLDVVRHQELGNRKDYWYSYTLVDEKSREVVVKTTTLRNVYDFIVHYKN